MKRTLALAAILTGGLSLSLLAQEGQLPAGVDPAKLAELQKQMQARFDQDRDGKLSPQEQLLAQEFMRRTGGLGTVGLPPGGFPGAAEFAQQFDKDGDGKLSAQEQIAASAAFQRMREGGGKPQTGVFPGGGDAAASSAGVPAGGQSEKPARTSGLVKRFDKDGDGKLNDAEKAALQAEVGKGKAKAKKAGDKPAAEKPIGEKPAVKP